jgi:hypothetical protein
MLLLGFQLLTLVILPMSFIMENVYVFLLPKKRMVSVYAAMAELLLNSEVASAFIPMLKFYLAIIHK